MTKGKQYLYLYEKDNPNIDDDNCIELECIAVDDDGTPSIFVLPPKHEVFNKLYEWLRKIIG